MATHSHTLPRAALPPEIWAPRLQALTTRVHVLSPGHVDALIALHYTLRGKPVDLAAAGSLPAELCAALDQDIAGLQSVVVPSTALPPAKAAKGRANYKSRYETAGCCISHVFLLAAHQFNNHSDYRGAGLKECDCQHHVWHAVGQRVRSAEDGERCRGSGIKFTSNRNRRQREDGSTCNLCSLNPLCRIRCTRPSARRGQQLGHGEPDSLEAVW